MQWNQLLHEFDWLESCESAVEVNGVEYDSRRVTPGCLFVAMRGEATDGNRFVDSALKQGASSIVTDSREVYAGLREKNEAGAALVERGRRALAEVSAALFGHPERRLALSAVTGTNGKTTTSFLLEQMMRAVERRCVLIGTVEYRVAGVMRPSLHTTPESRDVLSLFAEGVTAGCTEAVMEMSSHALEQERVWGLPVDVAIFTNLTQDHLDYHGSMEEYFRAKARLFTGVGTSPPRVSVINVDDAAGQRLEGIADGSQVLRYSVERDAEFRAEDVELKAGETRFRMHSPAGIVEMRSPLTGKVNVYNLLAASAAAWARGMNLEQIAWSTEGLGQVPGRFEVVRGGRGDLTVVVDYAHTEDALRNLIGLSRELVKPSRGRVITVFGCGGDRDTTKRPKMGRAAGEGSDLVVLTSDNPRSEDPLSILNAALAGVLETGADYIVEANRATAIEIAIRAARSGDIVLIAGKGHEKVQILREGAVPFDDVEVSTRVLKELA